jgi:hypothetical protein
MEEKKMKSLKRESVEIEKTIRTKRDYERRRKVKRAFNNANGQSSKQTYVPKSLIDIWFPGGC